MPNNILITPGQASIEFSGSAANNLKLQVLSNGNVAITGSIGKVAEFSNTGQVFITSSMQATQFTGSLGIIAFIGTASRVDDGAYLSIPQTFGALKTFASGIDLSNSDITGVNNITINDPGPNEGLLWAGGNLWRIYESPNDLTTNTGGNLQIVQNTTRRATFNTSGQLDIPVATGTAPFVITSTTLVTNLNADLVDGYQAAVAATANTVVARDASGGMTGSLFGTATTASYVAWPNVGLGTRTNYDLDFKPPASSYAGFRFSKSTSANGAADAGYLLIRGTSDSDVYTAEGITLVADGGWLTLAQRTTAARGVKIMTGTTSTNRVLFNTDGTVEYTGDTYNYSSANQVVFNHNSNTTVVPFEMRKGGTSLSDGGDYGTLQLSRTNHTDAATSAGSNLYFELKDNGGTLREYAGIGGRKTVAGASGGALYFYRYARTVMGYWDANGLYASALYDYDNNAFYVDPASTSRLNTIRGTQIATTYHSMTSTYYGGGATPSTGYLITTNIDYGTFNMPIVIIEGYAYGNAVPILLTIVWYSYSPDPTGWTNLSYINSGGWDPGTITIGRNGSGKVCIHISNNIYYGRFNVRAIYDQGHSYLEGWSVSEAGTAGLSQPRTIPRTTMITDISGNAGSETLQTVTSRGQTSNQSLVVTGLRLTSTFNTATNDVYANMRVIQNAGGGTADGMYIGYANAGSAITRIFGGGSTGGALEKYSTYTYEPGSFRAPIFYDSDSTTYYADFANTATSINIQGSLRAATYNKPAILSVASGTASTGASFAIQQETGEGWTGIFVDFEPYTGWGFYHDNPNNFFSFTAEASTGQIRSFTVPSRVSGNRTAYEKFRIDQNNGDVIVGRDGYAQSSYRAPIFYDSDNTAYYTNPRSDSRMSGLRLDGVDNQASGDDAILWINKPNNNDWGIIVTGNLEYLLDLRGASSHTYNIRGLAAGNEFWRVGTDLLYHNSQIRAPIFYDSADTGYYIDLNVNTTYGARLRSGILFGPNPTWGAYLYVGTDGRQGLIDSATPSVASTNGNLHMDAGSGYSMYLNYYDGNVIYFGGGSNNTWGEFSSGIFYAYNQMRSPIFYDYNNSGYYSDPNGTSRLNASVTDESYTYGWFRNYTSGQGLYNQAIGTHWYSNNGYWKAGAGGYGYGGIVLYQSYESSLRGYLYWDGSGFGLLNSSGNWQLRIEYGNANMELYRITWANDMRAYIYYDRDNTGYYLDPHSYSYVNSLRAASYLASNGNIYTDANYGYGLVGVYASTRYQGVFAMGDAYKLPPDGTTTGNLYGIAWSHPNAGGVAGNLSSHGLLVLINGGFGSSMSYNIVASSDVRGTIFYDYNNTGYYVDPNSVSQLSYVLANDWFRPQGCTGLYFQSYGRGLWSPECEGNSYGHVATYGGGRSGWYGYGIGSRYVFMSTMGDNVGVHDNSRGWIWYMSGAILYLYYASSERMSMQSYGVYINNGAWAPIYYDHNTSYYVDGDSYTSLNRFTDRTKASMGLTGKYNSPRWDYTGDSNYWTGVMGWGTTDFLSMWNWGSGFFDSWGSPANQPAGTSHWVGVQVAHYTCGYNCGYGWQLAGGPIAGLWFRNYWSSASSWKKLAMYDVNEYSYNMYANIYYDSDSTGYWVDPNAGQSANFAGWIRTSEISATNGCGRVYVNGNLHIDSYCGYSIYMNYYSGNWLRYFGPSEYYGNSIYGVNVFYAQVFYDANDGYYFIDPTAGTGNDKSIRVRGNISNTNYANDVYTPPGTISFGRSDRNDFRSYYSLWYAMKFSHSADPGHWQWSHHIGGCCMFSMMHYSYNTLTLGGSSIGWGQLSRVRVTTNQGFEVQNYDNAGEIGDTIRAIAYANPFYSTLFRGYLENSNSGWEKYIMLTTQFGTITHVVYGNGSTYNQTGAYGVWSDISLKQDIIDASSQWDDIKQLRLVKFRLKEEVSLLGDAAPHQLGLIAQEVEQVSPGLITESDVMEEYEDDELNPHGLPTGKKVKKQRTTGQKLKAVKQSILYMKAVKALQEAITRIEQLEEEIRILKAG